MSRLDVRDRVALLQFLGGAAAVLAIIAAAVGASAHRLEKHNQRMIAEGVEATAIVTYAKETRHHVRGGRYSYTHDLVLRWNGSAGEQLESRHSVSGEIYALAVRRNELEIRYIPGRTDLRPFILAEESGPATTQGLLGLCLFALAGAFGAAFLIEAFPRRRRSWPEAA